MTLPENTILENRYRIDRLLAQGGMGAIYRGLDTSLDIPVAIKENFLHTPDSIFQFQQEARILARLHHPNLPRVIHYFSFEDRQYLVMDFIGGQDLWEMVKERQEPLEEEQAIEYTLQVCDAVSYLHQQNPPIIHRDIKPQNIKVTPEGRAVLVDFGIAKVVESDIRTSTGAQGVTPGFSPPEQYGSGTTPVSDIYSLGATLYAVLTGKKPPNSISRITDSVEFEPIDRINPRLSRQVAEAVDHAMQIHPSQRPESMEAWRRELELIVNGYGGLAIDEAEPTVKSPREPISPSKSSSSPPKAPAANKPEGRGLPWLWIGVGFVLVLLVVGVIAFLAGRESSNGPPAAEIAPPEQSATPEPVDKEATLASLAVTATTQASEQAAVPTPTRPVDTATPTHTPQPTPTLPIFPIEGERIAFQTNRDGDWEIYVMRPDGSALGNLSANPASPDEQPTWSPDGQQLAYVSTHDSQPKVYLVNATGSSRTRLTAGSAIHPAWSPDGGLLAVSAGGVMGTISLTGSGWQRLSPGFGFYPAWSAVGGRLVFSDDDDLFVINRDGSGLTLLTGSPYREWDPAWSPDGQKVAYVFTAGGNDDIYLMDAGGGNITRLTRNPAGLAWQERQPAWSPDGQQLAFVSNRSGNWDIYVMNTDGSGLVQLTTDPADDLYPAWSSQ